MKQITGRLLYFDSEALGSVFTRDTVINIPDEVPILEEFDYLDPNKVLGSCRVIKDDLGLRIEGTIADDDKAEDLKRLSSEGYGIGGSYAVVMRGEHNSKKAKNIQSARLWAVGVTNGPVNKEYTFEIIDDTQI